MAKISRFLRFLRRSIDVRTFPSKKRTHLFVNIGIGLAIVILFHFLQDTRWGESTLDKFFDLFIRSESDKAARVQNDLQQARILFVDIDHKTYQQWGEPVITPRDKLAEILRILHDGGAKVVVLDILLEGKDCLPENDRKLLEVLEKIRQDTGGATQVVLAQRTGIDGELKRNLFDVLLENDPSADLSGWRRIYRAAPSVAATGSDYVVRYWNLYEEFRAGDGRKDVLWGIPIVAVLLAVDGNLESLKSFKTKLENGESRGRDYESLRLGNGKTIKLPFDQAHLYLQRLRFLLVPERSAQTISGERPVGEEGNLFQTALKFDELVYYQGLVKDKIVIVGNSSPEAGDVHRTPIGEIAGMYILGNSINTILAKEQPSPPPLWVTILFEIAVIVLAAYLFLCFTSLLAQVIASLLILTVFGYVSYLYFLKAGVFLNFVFAIVGMGFHETTKDLEVMIEKRGLLKYGRTSPQGK